MLNRQQTFETMVAHLRKQGALAQNATKTGCAYRGANQTMCAVGCLISDQDYDDGIEGSSAGAFEVIERIPDATTDDMEFLDHAQSALHDGFLGSPEDQFPTWLENQVPRFAKEFGLEIPS